MTKVVSNSKRVFGFNGRITRISGFIDTSPVPKFLPEIIKPIIPVKNKIVYAHWTSNHWSSTENNSNNSWNVNFNDGNFNNNNKYNSYVVRAVAALNPETKLGWVNAFLDCQKKKKSSIQCTMYRYMYGGDLFLLAGQVETRTYMPTTSNCFVVTRPKLREIFAANFRDRIVQHWITIRVEPLIEERFIEQGNVSFNCRKGFGTLAAVNAVKEDIIELSEGYTKETWIGKYDLTSFFMSIDTEILLKLLIPFIREKYLGPDLEKLIWLTEITIRNRPEKNCLKRGDIHLWDILEPKKSLFNSEPGIGMPIGNITSQQLANFYLSFFDEFILGLCKKYNARYRRFVDDFVIVCSSKSDIQKIAIEGKVWLKENLHITMHPNKIYLQEVKKGVKFVGTVIKPGRTYLSNRTIGGFYKMLTDMETTCRKIYKKFRDKSVDLSVDYFDLYHYIISCNSYLGFLVQCNTYAIRRKIFKKFPYFWQICTLTRDWRVVRIREKYKIENYLLCM